MTRRKRRRCGWVGSSDLDIEYHDLEWGVPSRDDRHLFEQLILEGAQAGLSWQTILQKREGYRAAYRGFDPAVVARFNVRSRARLLQDSGIVRNRLKVESSVSNAKALLAIQRSSRASTFVRALGCSKIRASFATASRSNLP